MTDPAPEPRFEQAPLVDAHLDLAFNAVGLGRDLTLPLDELRATEALTRQSAMVTWPELRAAGIDLVFGTLFARPAERVAMQPEPPSAGANAAAAAETAEDGAGPVADAAREGYAERSEAEERTTTAPPDPFEDVAPGYRDAEGAHLQARAQLDWYRDMEAIGWARIVTSQADLAALRAERAASWEAPIGVVLLMEGADPIRTPDEVQWWWEQGLRIVGPAWQRTRYAGGTRAPGPLTPLGEALIDAMRELGMALDVSHLADESLWQALERFDGPVLASHSNARALTPTDRHLSDDALRALGERDGVVGMVLGSAFLDPATTRDRAADLRSVRRHFNHLRKHVGSRRVGIGSDLDGGFGVEETPIELTRGADFGRLGKAVPRELRSSFLGGAWWAWLERSLPST